MGWSAARYRKRFTASIRIILVFGLTGLSGYLAVLMIHDRLPWTTPDTYSLNRFDWHVWGGKLFVHRSFDIDKSEQSQGEFRISSVRAKREVYVIYPDDSNGQPDHTREPERYVATISVQLPTWPLLVLMGFYPTWVLVFARKRRRERRRRAGLCVQCAYDMTGNTTGVCPECGTRVK